MTSGLSQTTRRCDARAVGDAGRETLQFAKHTAPAHVRSNAARPVTLQECPAGSAALGHAAQEWAKGCCCQVTRAPVRPSAVVLRQVWADANEDQSLVVEIVEHDASISDSDAAR